FEIGDTLTEGAKFSYEEIPSFAPEHFSRVVMTDPMRRKQLKKGLEQLAQEGTIQLYRPPEGREGDAILGAVGRLQLEVVKHRLGSEYDVDVRLEPMAGACARTRGDLPVRAMRPRALPCAALLRACSGSNAGSAAAPDAGRPKHAAAPTEDDAPVAGDPAGPPYPIVLAHGMGGFGTLKG